MATRTTSGLFYNGTRDEVALGDRVRLRRWFGRDEYGVVCYIPGLNPLHPELGEDQWAIRSDDGVTIWAMAYDPRGRELRSGIFLIERGHDHPVAPDEIIDFEQQSAPEKR